MIPEGIVTTIAITYLNKLLTLKAWLHLTIASVTQLTPGIKSNITCISLGNFSNAFSKPLALAIIKKLLDSNCFGIITTHYSLLKEYAVESNKLENASMEFDAKTLRPMYKLNIGIPGSSNAIDIAKTLGIDNDIIDNAVSISLSMAS